ncbi:hypothetical protein CA830_32395, partial [Burkholderia multivorans]
SSAAGASGDTTSAGATPTGPTLGAAGSDADNPAVKQLKQLIERLQKQLAQLQQQIARAAQRAKTDPAAAVEQQALSAE